MRADYIKTQIDWALKAKKEGVNLHGYMVWSGRDNFEWVAGYTKHLGLIYVDFATQERTTKQLVCKIMAAVNLFVSCELPTISKV